MHFNSIQRISQKNGAGGSGLLGALLLAVFLITGMVCGQTLPAQAAEGCAAFTKYLTEAKSVSEGQESNFLAQCKQRAVGVWHQQCKELCPTMTKSEAGLKGCEKGCDMMKDMMNNN
jgi:hypothetical protein